MKYLREKKKICLTEHKYEHTSWKQLDTSSINHLYTHSTQLKKEFSFALSDYAEDVIDNDKLIQEMEICTRKNIHVLCDNDNKRKGVMETQALEIKCESVLSDRLEKLLCKAHLAEHRNGKFVAHALARNDPGYLITQHITSFSPKSCPILFWASRRCSSILGNGSGKRRRRWHFTQQDARGRDRDGNSRRRKHIGTYSTFSWTRNEGNGFSLRKRKNAEIASRLIDDFLIPTTELLPAFKNHSNDKSFKQGVGRTNKPNTAMQNYAAILREKMTIPKDSDKNGAYDQYNYAKKCKQILLFTIAQNFWPFHKVRRNSNKHRPNKQQRQYKQSHQKQAT